MKKLTKRVKGPSQALPVVDLYPISQKLTGGSGKAAAVPGAMGGQPAYF
jgi:hypothetical protein